MDCGCIYSSCHYIVWHYSYFASSGDSRPYNKYYTSVRVEEGDTVWSIADRYIADSQVSKRDYVDEICRLNSLTDGNVRSGDYIVVSYYSQDIK